MVSQCSLNAWLVGWLAEISTDALEALCDDAQYNYTFSLFYYFTVTRDVTQHL